MLYNFGIYCYAFLARILAVFNHKAKLFTAGRKNIWEKLPEVNNQNVTWFHCASLGEYDQGLPIIQAWKKKFPNDFILITFFSPSGYEILKNKHIGDFACYLPLDTKRNAKRFIHHFAPKNVLFIKYEFWINYLNFAKKNGAKLYLISAVFHSKQPFFKWYGGIFRKTLKHFNHIFIQYESSAPFLNQLAYKQYTITGDTRFDRVFERKLNKNDNDIIKTWLNDKKAFVIGSSWKEDLEIIIPLINKMMFPAKIIIAPHQVDEKSIQETTNALSLSFERYTKIKQNIQPETQVLILDCIGVLADAYQYGKIAYVGGAFKTGLHNILEPAVFGLPVIFGPQHHKFEEASKFMETGIGFSISNYITLENTYLHINNHLSEIQNKTKSFMEKQIGACDKITKEIFKDC